MTTSVILSSYNGEKYIEEQLLSIMDQTVAPDEVIIKDDCSTDSTVDIVRRFIAENKLLSWKLVVNDSNVGWMRNFMEGMKLTTGELVFFCDQDDIWMQSKVEEMLQVFANRSVKLLVSDLVPFSDDGSSVYVFHPKLGKGRVSQVKCDVHIGEIRRPGCTYCFRREMIDEINKVWFDGWAHDSCLWTVAMAQNGLYSYNRPLIRYRRHRGTNSPSNEKRKKRRIELSDTNYQIVEKVLFHSKELCISDENIRELKNAQDFYLKRIESIEKRSLVGFIKMIPYLPCYPKLSAFIGDMIASGR